MTNCANCGHQNPGDAKFCSQCGTALPLSCPQCGAAYRAGDRFCSNCGASLSDAPASVGTAPEPSQTAEAAARDGIPEAERREVSVLFSDLTGFTEWSDKLDPEETHELLNRYFDVADDIIVSHGGRIDKHIGDALMAVFGAPVSHGNDPERAVRAAHAIHAALAEFDPPLMAHIGVANGVVVASRTGSDAHDEYTVTGSSVNLASRLQNLADGGQTLVSDRVRDSLHDGFDWEAMGETSIKGFDKPIPVWRLNGLATSRGPSPGSDFVGRHGELAQIVGVLSASAQSPTGTVLRLRGEPGIGKSRLTMEVKRRASEIGYLVVTSVVLDFGMAKGRDAVASIVRGFLGLSDTDGANTELDALDALFVEGEFPDDERVFLHDMLDLPLGAELRSVYDAMDQADRTAGKAAALARLATQAAVDRPVLIVVEDVHWADAGTLAILARLAGCAAQATLVLLATTRLDGDPLDANWRAAAPGARIATIDLGPLNEREAAELASRYFDVKDGLLKASIERASGNPLFLEQLLRSANEVQSQALPGTIQSIVQARVDALRPEDRHALQAAAVLGQRFAAGAVRALLGSEHYACEELVGHSLIRPDGDEFMFTHALIRDGVYSSLIASRRQELHANAAQWFAERDPPLHARHLARADSPEAPAAFVAATRAEMDAYHVDQAIDLAEEGLEIAKGPERHELRCLHGDLLRGLGSNEPSIEAFQSAVQEAAHDLERCRALVGLAEGLRASGQATEALRFAKEAEGLAGDDEPLLCAEIHHLQGNLYFPTADIDNCLSEHEAAVSWARKGGSSSWEARALGGLGDAFYLKARMRTSCETFQRCVELSRELGLGRTEVANLHMIGWTRIYLNELEEALADGLAAVELAKRTRQARSEMLGQQLLALVLIDLGRLEEAAIRAGASVEIAERLGHRYFRVQGLSQKARALNLQGERREARTILDACLDDMPAIGRRFIGPVVMTLRGGAAENRDERERFYKDADLIMAEGCVSHNYFWSYRDRIEVALMDGDLATAEKTARQLEDYSAGEPLPWSNLFVDLARLVIAARNGASDSAALDRLRSEVDRAGYATAAKILAGIV